METQPAELGHASLSTGRPKPDPGTCPLELFWDAEGRSLAVRTDTGLQEVLGWMGKEAGIQNTEMSGGRLPLLKSQPTTSLLSFQPADEEVSRRTAATDACLLL